MCGSRILLGLSLTLLPAFAQEGGRLDLGRLQTGATVSFVRTAGGKWGIECTGGTSPRLTQQNPARIEVCRTKDDILELAAGYNTIRQSDSAIDARAEIAYGKDVVFRVRDLWSLSGAVVSIRRKVEVVGNAPGGFNSSIVFAIDSSLRWSDVNCLAPGILYGDPTNDGDRSPGGTLNYAAHRFVMREDMLPAPMFALSFNGGSSMTMLDPSPNGESTVEETRLTKDVMTDARFQFGAMGAWQTDNHPIEFGFQFPGTMTMYRFGFGAVGTPRWIRRYHPIEQGVDHRYEVQFRFGKNESFRDVSRNSWRWAWNTLKPAVIPIDVGTVRRILIDHLRSQAASIDGRTAIPFAVSTVDTSQWQWNWTMSVMGFVSKTIECADQFLREGYRDSTTRGTAMRQTGLSIISSIINALHDIPLQGSGYDLATGKPWTGDHKEWLAPFLRNATEDMRVLVQAYRREHSRGHEHPEWLAWAKSYADWLLRQQREDGSFPRRWKEGTSVAAETTGSTSNAAVPLLVLMTEETRDPRYQQSAIRAADYVWAHYGDRGLYVGGASDNPNMTDKEAGMLSIEAFMSLYESTKETQWLDRAKAAADYTESWIWTWNLPMPVDADNAHLHWKKGVPTVGLQGITARGAGGADEYLDWAAPSYAMLYEYTKDEHYLYVARVLLHDTKSMVALPGRLYDLKGIGWQQEHWSMGPGWFGRGVGGHRFWLAWISANHLHSINGLDELDSAVYKRMISNE
jgi:hypothetical protein